MAETKPSSFAPAGWHTVTPRIAVEDAKGLVAFLKQVFGAGGEYSDVRPALVSIGDSLIMITDAGVRQRMTAFLYIYVADADSVYQRALRAGARSLEAPVDTPYGDRRAMIEDQWGNTWQIATYRRTD
jgi:PhnB protein